MSWLQIRVQCQRSQAEKIEDAILAAGAASVTMEDDADQPILEPGVGETPLWDNIKVTGLFSADTDTTQATLIATAALGNSLPPYRWEILEDKDWERAWMDTYHPMRFGENLWICPSWLEPPEPEATNIMLDPGLAFGTGTHPTTALCLEWLDSADVKDKVIIDYGCGSGILGIAALLLGAKKVIAVDNDPQALIATLDNAQNNNIKPKRISTYLPEDTPNIKADIVLANILAGPLTELAATLSQHCLADGDIVLSGLLDVQAEDLSQHYQQWFAMQPAVNQEGWMRLSGKRKAS
ncbi:50S ribosomal protein L11 methyltransferase [Dasania marina]|uniref:50S ribosomal protein L11 methyltransferase n=1 Tax=Dasania marina TaxID=471499 RepID=UPI0030D7BB04|tara:strand:+ start:8036 stop:8920 length:885 start_codon:yes stop_codon:yes gene_type:complete